MLATLKLRSWLAAFIDEAQQRSVGGVIYGFGIVNIFLALGWPGSRRIQNLGDLILEVSTILLSSSVSLDIHELLQGILTSLLCACSLSIAGRSNVLIPTIEAQSEASTHLHVVDLVQSLYERLYFLFACFAKISDHSIIIEQ